MMRISAGPGPAAPRSSAGDAAAAEHELADPGEPPQVVDVRVQLRHEDERLGHVRFQPRDPASLAAGDARLVFHEAEQPAGQVRVDRRRTPRRGPGLRERVGMHAVDHEAHERHVLLAQAPVEVPRLVEGGPRRPRHQHEARILAAEELMDPLGPLLEPLVHALEGQEELRQVLQELEAEEAVGQLEGEGAGPRRDLQREPAGDEVRLEEPPEHARVQEAHEAVGRLEEIEGMPGGRRVEDHEVEALVGRQLEQLLHRHVLVAARERGRDLLVEAVVEDAAAGGLARGVLVDERIERAPRVERHRPQRARRPRRQAREVEPPRSALERGQAEAGREAAGGVDRADEHLAPFERRLQGQGGGGRRLAHAAGAADDEHATLGQRGREGAGGAVGPRRLHAASRRRASRSIEAGPMSSSKR
jgi:hypothetical protein